MKGATAAVIGRSLGIPATRIRKWAQLGNVHRYPDGSLNPHCVLAWQQRETLGGRFAAWHDERCGVSCLRSRAA